MGKPIEQECWLTLDKMVSDGKQNSIYLFGTRSSLSRLSMPSPTDPALASCLVKQVRWDRGSSVRSAGSGYACTDQGVAFVWRHRPAAVVRPEDGVKVALDSSSLTLVGLPVVNHFRHAAAG